jgi:hypothetical protein
LFRRHLRGTSIVRDAVMRQQGEHSFRRWHSAGRAPPPAA